MGGDLGFGLEVGICICLQVQGLHLIYSKWCQVNWCQMETRATQAHCMFGLNSAVPCRQEHCPGQIFESSQLAWWHSCSVCTTFTCVGKRRTWYQGRLELGKARHCTAMCWGSTRPPPVIHTDVTSKHQKHFFLISSVHHWHCLIAERKSERLSTNDNGCGHHPQGEKSNASMDRNCIKRISRLFLMADNMNYMT